jgi:succinoglycan biosynthesis protein ExoM
MNESYFISVCTLGESTNLTRCLNALLEISMDSPEKIQIAVVVNSAKSDLVFDTRILEVYEPIRGYSSVRNAAISNAPKNCNLIFVDDDELPTKTWFAAMIDSHRRYPLDVIFGPVFSDSGSNSGFYREKFKSKYESMPDGALVSQAGAGNMLIPSYLLDAHRVKFDLLFNTSGSEDTDLCFRLRKQGVGIRFAKSAIITEIQGEERKDHQYLNARRIRDISNFSVVIRRNSSVYGIAWRFATLTLRLAFYSIAAIFNSDLKFEQKVYLKSTEALITGKVV